MSFDIVYALAETEVVRGTIWTRDPHGIWLVCDQGATASDDDDDEFPLPLPSNHLVVDTSRLDGAPGPAMFALEQFTRQAAQLIAGGAAQRVDLDLTTAGEYWGFRGRYEGRQESAR